MEESTHTHAVPDAEQLEALVAKLDSIIFGCRHRRREASVEAGRAFSELKQLLNHGKWQRHVEETFGPHGITLRTAERWMRRAREKDSTSENDTMSDFKEASDEGAKEIRKNNERAKAEADAAANRSEATKEVRLIYRLPLRMNADEHTATNTLLKLPDWPRAERKVVHLLRELWVKYGVVKDDDGRHS